MFLMNPKLSLSLSPFICKNIFQINKHLKTGGERAEDEAVKEKFCWKREALRIDQSRWGLENLGTCSIQVGPVTPTQCYNWMKVGFQISAGILSGRKGRGSTRHSELCIKKDHFCYVTTLPWSCWSRHFTNSSVSIPYMFQRTIFIFVNLSSDLIIFIILQMVFLILFLKYSPLLYKRFKSPR